MEEEAKWEYHKRQLFAEYNEYEWPVHLIARCSKCGHEENADDWFYNQKQAERCPGCGTTMKKDL